MTKSSSRSAVVKNPRRTSTDPACGPTNKQIVRPFQSANSISNVDFEEGGDCDDDDDDDDDAVAALGVCGGGACVSEWQV